MQPGDSDHYFDLRDEADRQAQVAASAVPPAKDREGSDTAGVVKVRVGSDGILREIHLAMDWQQHLDAEEVAPAIMAAIASISAATAAEWSERLEELQDQPAPQTRPLPQWIAGEADDLPSDSQVPEESRLAQLSAIFDQISSQLDDAIAQGEQMISHTETARSARGEVEVRIGSNGSINELTLSPQWLTKAHPSNVGRLVLETLQTAQRRSVASFADFNGKASITTEALSKYQDMRYLSQRFGLY